MAIGFIYDQSGGFRKAQDCVPRALAAFTGEDYKTVRATVEKWQAQATGRKSIANGARDTAIFAAAQDLGLVRVPAHYPKAQGGKWLTFADAYAKYGNCVIKIRGHLTAVIDGNVRDTWDCSTYRWQGEIRERKCIYVWVTPEQAKAAGVKPLKGGTVIEKPKAPKRKRRVCPECNRTRLIPLGVRQCKECTAILQARCSVVGCNRKAVSGDTCDLPRHSCEGCGIPISSPNCRSLYVDCGEVFCDLCY